VLPHPQLLLDLIICRTGSAGKTRRFFSWPRTDPTHPRHQAANLGPMASSTGRWPAQPTQVMQFAHQGCTGRQRSASMLMYQGGICGQCSTSVRRGGMESWWMAAAHRFGIPPHGEMHQRGGGRRGSYRLAFVAS